MINGLITFQVSFQAKDGTVTDLGPFTATVEDMRFGFGRYAFINPRTAQCVILCVPDHVKNARAA